MQIQTIWHLIDWDNTFEAWRIISEIGTKLLDNWNVFQFIYSNFKLLPFSWCLFSNLSLIQVLALYLSDMPPLFCGSRAQWVLFSHDTLKNPGLSLISLLLSLTVPMHFFIYSMGFFSLRLRRVPFSKTTLWHRKINQNFFMFSNCFCNYWFCKADLKKLSWVG